jgi:dolichyl-phosphate beta-glucosyltransferase
MKFFPDEPYLTLIFPIYRQEALLESSLREVFSFLSSKSFRSEILLVEDAGEDGSLKILRRFEKESNERVRVVVLSNPVNRGKGFSVRRGMSEGRGKYVLFMDIDLAYRLEDVDRIVHALEEGSDLAIACRTLPESVYIISPSFFHYLYTRHLMSRLFNFFVRLWLGLATRDTQAGLKGFRREAARKIFSRQRINRFSFDVEVLYLAKRLGLRITEVPVTFRYFDEPSTVKFLRDGGKMLYDLWRIRWRGWTGPSP